MGADDTTKGGAPLIEVAYGTRFVAPDFGVVHFGQFYERVKAQFPTVRTLGPIIPQPVPDQVIELPPLPRVWFERGTRLLQLQSDRFIFNWRHVAGIDELYPGYDKLSREFLDQLSTFVTFAKEALQLPMQLIELSLNYVNQLHDAPDAGSPMFVFRNSSFETTLPRPELWISQLRFGFEEQNARLTASARPAIHLQTQSRVTQFDMMVESRQAPTIDDAVAIGKWFDVAHDLVHRAFRSLVHEEWLAQWGFFENHVR